MKASHVVVFLAMLIAAVPAFPKNGAPSRLFPYYEEDTGVRVLAQVVYVGTRKEIVELGDHYQFLLSTGVPDTEITDGRLAVLHLYCCGGKISEQQSIWIYVPPSQTVEAEDFVEVRMGRVPREGDPGAVNTLTTVRQKRADGGGPCRWEPDTPGLWMRVVHCDGIENDGWLQRGRLRKLWYRPAGLPDKPVVDEVSAAQATPQQEPSAERPAATDAVTPAQEEAGADEGIVYVYHLSESNYAQGMGTLALRRALIYVDGEKVAALTHGTHTRISLPPGPHAFQAKVSIYGMPGLPISPMTIDVERGGTYYLHYFEQGMGLGGYVSQHMIQEDAPEGAEGVRRTRDKTPDEED